MNPDDHNNCLPYEPLRDAYFIPPMTRNGRLDISTSKLLPTELIHNNKSPTSVIDNERRSHNRRTKSYSQLVRPLPLMVSSTQQHSKSMDFCMGGRKQRRRSSIHTTTGSRQSDYPTIRENQQQSNHPTQEVVTLGKDWTEFVDMTDIDPEQHKSLLDESELKISFCLETINDDKLLGGVRKQRKGRSKDTRGSVDGTSLDQIINRYNKQRRNELVKVLPKADHLLVAASSRPKPKRRIASAPTA